MISPPQNPKRYLPSWLSSPLSSTAHKCVAVRINATTCDSLLRTYKGLGGRGCFQSFLQPLFPKSLAGSLCQVEDGPGTHGLGASCDRRNSTLLCGCQRRTTDSLCPILGKDICRQRQIFHDLGQVILQLFNGFSVSRFPVWRHTDGATW